MKINKISLVIGIGSIIWIIFSMIKWFIIYPYTTMAIVATSIGLIMLGGAYIYHWMKEIDEKVAEYNEALDKTNKRIWDLIENQNERGYKNEEYKKI